MKTCKEYAALLDALIDGELSGEEAARVRAHLRDCAGCSAYVEAAAAIRSSFPTLEDTVMPDGFADAVCAAIRADAAPRKRKTARWAKIAVSMAACAALVFAAVRLVPMNGGYGAAAPADEVVASAAADSSASAGAAKAAPGSGEDSGMADSAADPTAPETTERMLGDSAGDTVGIPAATQFALAPEGAGAAESEADGSTFSNTETQKTAAEYDRSISLTPEQAGSLLENVRNAIVYSDTLVAYEMDRETFNDILAALPAELADHVEDGEGTLCCVFVTG